MISNLIQHYSHLIPNFIKNRFGYTIEYLSEIENYIRYKITHDEIVDTGYGVEIYVNKVDFAERRLATDEGGPEKQGMEYFVQTAKDCDGDLVDIGSNIGIYSLIFCENAEGTPFAFEPLSRNISRIKQNAELNSSEIEVFNFGLSNKTEVVDLSYPITNIGAASATDMEETQLVWTQETQSKKLDDINIDSENISIVKIDVEGWELDVLRGARQTLQHHHPDLLIEIHQDKIQQRGHSKHELIDILDSLGYSSYIKTCKGEEVTIGSSNLEKFNSDTNMIHVTQ